MNNVINIESGGIEYKNQSILLNSSINELYEKLSDDIELIEQRYGWDELKLSSFESEGMIFNFQCLFDKGKLRIIELYLQFNNIPEPNSWDDWSEEFEKQKERELNLWLNQNIGTQREFHWGVIQCSYDKRSGYSDIWIKS